jgi:hypothetical protein
MDPQFPTVPADDDGMRSRAPRRTIASYVPPQAFAPRTRAALEGLGYRLVPVATQGRFHDASWKPDLRLVDPRYLARLPAGEAAGPIILLASSGPQVLEDPRVVGVAPCPAEVGTLYPLLQQALEKTPRRAARAPARIPARCSRAERRWTGEVLSLSETGCLLRAPSDLAPELEFNLLFALPLGRMISTRARVLQHCEDRSGLAFRSPSNQVREAIGDYVQRRLATL